jgi:hypothetical protein
VVQWLMLLPERHPRLHPQPSAHTVTPPPSRTVATSLTCCNCCCNCHAQRSSNTARHPPPLGRSRLSWCSCDTLSYGMWCTGTCPNAVRDDMRQCIHSPQIKLSRPAWPPTVPYCHNQPELLQTLLLLSRSAKVLPPPPPGGRHVSWMQWIGGVGDGALAAVHFLWVVPENTDSGGSQCSHSSTCRSPAHFTAKLLLLWLLLLMHGAW